MSQAQRMHLLLDVFQMTAIVLISVINHYYINELNLFWDNLCLSLSWDFFGLILRNLVLLRPSIFTYSFISVYLIVLFLIFPGRFCIFLFSFIVLFHPFFFLICFFHKKPDIFYHRKFHGPVGWGCRIYQQHICQGIRFLQQESYF